MNKFELGQGVYDIITGFVGTVTGTCTYITGCDTYMVTPKCQDNKPVESKWFDANRLAAHGDADLKVGSLKSNKVEENGSMDEPPTK